MDASVYSKNIPRLNPSKVEFAARGVSHTPIDTKAQFVLGVGSECHVTPQWVAREMALSAGLEDGMSVLEPSFGTGRLLLAAASEANVVLTGVEREKVLYDHVMAQMPTADLHLGDFLEFAKTCSTKFDRVLINPPFSKGLKHIEAARKLLVPGGLMVALVPCSYNMGKMLVQLPAGTFMATRVATKLITLDAC